MLAARDPITPHESPAFNIGAYPSALTCESGGAIATCENVRSSQLR